MNETIWQVRWDIPTALDVTLAANDQACCIPPSNDCGAGDCVVLTDACSVLASDIGGNPSCPVASPIGYANPGVVHPTGDRPFAGEVLISGTAECMSGVHYYAFEVSSDKVTYVPVDPATCGTITRTYIQSQSAHVPASQLCSSANRRVRGLRISTHWEGINGVKLWLFWRDLLLTWLTPGSYADGTYYLRLIGGSLAEVISSIDTCCSNAVTHRKTASC